MKNKFKIGEIADMLDVSTDTLRIYDNQGLLSPIKDSDNNYRYYKCSDLICLDYIIHLRKMDMSLKNINQLINHSSLEDEYLEMENQEKVINSKIEELQGLLESIKDYRKDLDRIENKLNKFTVEYSPQMIAMDLDNVDKRAVKKFSEIIGTKMPYFAFLYDNVNIKKTGYSELLLDENERIKIYKHRRIVIDNEKKYTAKDIGCKGIDIIAPKKCINVIVKSSPNKDYSCTDMVGEYLLKNNIHPKGDSVIRVLTVRRGIKQGNDYYEVWIPIE